MEFIISRFFSIIFTVCLIFFLSSCFPSAGRNLVPRDKDLYNKVGFNPGQRPGERAIPRSQTQVPVQVVPDYYYRDSGSRVVNSVPVQYAPASRFYSNPYALKPPQNFPYYDSDQYYVPPRGLSGVNRNNIDSRDSVGSSYQRSVNPRSAPIVNQPTYNPYQAQVPVSSGAIGPSNSNQNGGNVNLDGYF